MSLAVAAVGAFGYALLELAFFASRNQLLPWRPQHATLGAVFFAMHLAVALTGLVVAKVLTRIVRRQNDPIVTFAPLATLLAVHGASFFRERFYALPRDVGGTLGTLALAILPFAAARLVVWLLRNRPQTAHRVALGGAALVAAVGAIQIATARAPQAASRVLSRAASHQLQPQDTGQRVFVFGFDGATWTVLDPMLAAGRLPNLAALIARGRTFRVKTIRPTFSPVIWTSVATGKDDSLHGVHDVVQTVLPGGVRLPRSILRTSFYTKTTGVVFRALDRRRRLRLVPYQSDQVQATSVFEAASEAGLSASEIEWYVTYPARALSGVCVSDRFHLQKIDAPFAAATSPAGLNTSILPLLVTKDDVPVEQALAMVDMTGLDAAAAHDWAQKHQRVVDEIRLNLARDLTTLNVAVDLLQRDQSWKLFAVYFRAVDLSHHVAWKLRDREGDLDRDSELRLKPLIERYYEFMDGVVGKVLANVPPEAVVLMLSDHGFEDKFAHSRAPDGFAVLAGGATVPSAARDSLSIYDAAPTIAQLLGLPVAQDLEKRPREDLLDPAFVARFPPKEVSTWEREGRPAATSEAAEPAGALDAEVERLRALGYIR